MTIVQSRFEDYLDLEGRLPIAGQFMDPRTLGYVYAISMPQQDIVKIGSTNDPQLRLLELQCGNPFELRVAGLVCVYEGSPHKVESGAHKIASKMRIRGEWFALSAEEAVETIIAAARAAKVKFGAWAKERERIERENDVMRECQERQRLENLRRKLGMD